MTTFDLDHLTLGYGSHDPGSDEMCVMEAVAMLAGEEWSDHPQCASPVIAEWVDTEDGVDRTVGCAGDLLALAGWCVVVVAGASVGAVVAWLFGRCGGAR